MSNFKIKNNKKEKLESTNTTTLDKRHKEQTEMFKFEKDNLPQKEEKLIKLKKDLESFDDKTVIYNNVNLKKKNKLLDDIDKLEIEISEIKNNKNELDYYDKTGEIIFDYYKLRDDKKNEFSETKIY